MAAVLELLWPEQCVGEVDEQPGGDDAGEPVIEDHVCLLKTVAGVDVGNRQREEAKADSDQDEVEHGALLYKRTGAEPGKGRPLVAGDGSAW
jgi:hypothetical protein